MQNQAPELQRMRQELLSVVGILRGLEFLMGEKRAQQILRRQQVALLSIHERLSAMSGRQEAKGGS